MHRMKYFLTIISLTLFSAPASTKDKQVVGWVEYAKIFPSELKFKSKLDTGAYNSSIHAENIEEFERDGKTWVKFDVLNHNNTGTTLELPVAKEVTIKRHFGEKEKRYAVMLGICLGKTYKKTLVSLVDREGFLYELLIGRNYLKSGFIIDPAETFETTPKCQVPQDE